MVLTVIQAQDVGIVEILGAAAKQWRRSRTPPRETSPLAGGASQLYISMAILLFRSLNTEHAIS